MINNSHQHSVFHISHLFLLFLFIMVAGYLVATIFLYQKGKRWPIIRCCLWLLGWACIGSTFVGPIADQALHHFLFHMIGHILIGMLAPLLLVLARPMTLLFNILPVKYARRLTTVLKSWPFKVLSDPTVTAVLNIGGLVVLYKTELFSLMHDHFILASLIHLHMFLAGFAFTFSILCMDPIAHKRSFTYRAIVLILAIAAHGVLSKYMYAHPPLGVSQKEAELGAMLMYYGGDVIDLGLVYFLCQEWYRVRGRRLEIHKKTSYYLKG